jgi:CheY-like chemotaxis protein
VDDDADIRDTLRFLLEDSGYEVLTAANGSDALVQLEGGARPSVILLDLMMPVMNGYEFAAEKSREAALADIPVVIITADGNAMQKATAVGARGHLRKPFTLDAVLREVERFH